MGGTYARDWKPTNFRGAWNYDPRGELAARANVARDNGDTYVAVPLALAMACAEIRECGARTVLRYDEDGELPTPQEIQCRKPEGHDHDHFTGYCSWADATPTPAVPAGTSSPAPSSTPPAHATNHPADATTAAHDPEPTGHRAAPQPAATQTQPTSLHGGTT